MSSRSTGEVNSNRVTSSLLRKWTRLPTHAYEIRALTFKVTDNFGSNDVLPCGAYGPSSASLEKSSPWEQAAQESWNIHLNRSLPREHGAGEALCREELTHRASRTRGFRRRPLELMCLLWRAAQGFCCPHGWTCSTHNSQCQFGKRYK